MKYTIEGFSQKMLKKYELDIIDAAILRYFIDFKDSGNMITKLIDNKQYYWLKYEGIIEELPILNLNKPDSIYRRLKKMVSSGILENVTLKQCGVYSFFRTGINYMSLISDKARSDENPSDSDINPNVTDGNPSISDTYPNDSDINPEQKTHLLYPSTNNPSTNNKRNKKIQYAEFINMTQEEFNKLVEQYGLENTKRMIEILDNYKGSSGKSYKSDYRAILNWVVDRITKENSKPEHTQKKNSNWNLESQREYDFDDLEKRLLHKSFAQENV